MLAPLVLLYQSIVLALGQVWANKLRSLLTTLGIIIGVASVTSVIAALTGLKQTHPDPVGKLSSANRIFIMPHQPDDGHHHRWKELPDFHPPRF